ncbi:hypothetical protein D3P08_04445 [Paenibacillus nanensis]|uniref:Transcription factor zinc-finger domain-containing protein n=1 Tax=Paenibacillus nanensis TaxID=393251 RepID=A0A3A1VI68_9BACL|nr:hypothetical protein D3P08_04445 [Paenibacillus nanensis]
MKCPVCDDVKMREVQKEDVLIDVCPECKGVWLDRGELEKLMQGVREVRQDYERMEQHMQKDATPYNPQSAPSGGFGSSQPYTNPPSGQPFGNPQGGSQNGPSFGGGQPYASPQQGGFGAAPPTPGSHGSYSPPPAGYGSGQPSNPGYPPPQNYGHGYGKDHYGYDKYGRPYKKKKTVLDVFGDLFD